MSENSKLTPVEWEIMEVIWKFGNRVAARDVVKEAFPNGEKAYTTIQTIMNTLHKKGMLTREKIGNVNFFTPTRTRNKMVKQELSQFVGRVFDGSTQALANYLIDQDNLEIRELEEIKDLVLKKEEELRSKS